MTMMGLGTGGQLVYCEEKTSESCFSSVYSFLDTGYHDPSSIIYQLTKAIHAAIGKDLYQIPSHKCPSGSQKVSADV